MKMLTENMSSAERVLSPDTIEEESAGLALSLELSITHFKKASGI